MSCFEHFSEDDPEGAKMAQERIWKEFAEAAGVDVTTLRRAYGRITFDGYFGPVSDAEWNDAHTTDEEDANNPPVTMTHAKEILRAALDHNPEVKYTHPDHGWTCGGRDDHCCHTDHRDLQNEEPMFHEEPLTIEAYELKKAFFGELITIYGSLRC